MRSALLEREALESGVKGKSAVKVKQKSEGSLYSHSREQEWIEGSTEGAKALRFLSIYTIVCVYLQFIFLSMNPYKTLQRKHARGSYMKFNVFSLSQHPFPTARTHLCYQ